MFKQIAAEPKGFRRQEDRERLRHLNERVGVEAPTLGSLNRFPRIRHKLHAICALYAHTPTAAQRLELLDSLEVLAVQTAQELAVQLLEAGWRPGLDEDDGHDNT